MLVVTDRGHDQIRAIRRNHAALRKSGAGICVLDCRVHAQASYDDAKHEVEADEESVQRAVRAREERVKHARQCDCRGVHAACRTD